MTMTVTSTMTTHDPSARDVDLAVRAVLAELAVPRMNGRPPGSGVGADTTRGDEIFPGRLLSLRQAETLDKGLRWLRVAPGTVVTPLARDFLKKRGVEVRFAPRAEIEAFRNPGQWGFTIEPTSGVISAFRRALLDGPDLWNELGPDYNEALGWVSGSEERGVLALVDEASLAVYRACQVPGVRAASVSEVPSAARAIRALGVNVLVIEPQGKPIALLKQIGATFRKAGAPRAPGGMGIVRGGSMR